MKAYLLKTVDHNLRDENGLQYPNSGYVKCNDRNPLPFSGSGGIHGVINGFGVGSTFSWDLNNRWMVIEVDVEYVVNLIGCVKAMEGNVIKIGDQEDVVSWLFKRTRSPIKGGLINNGSIIKLVYEFPETFYDIAKLTGDIWVGGSLDATHPFVEKLPDNLVVSGHLNLYKSSIGSLPKNLKVGGSLNIANSKIKVLPDDLVVLGRIHLQNSLVTKTPPNSSDTFFCW